jgi:hypothetical protein
VRHSHPSRAQVAQEILSDELPQAGCRCAAVPHQLLCYQGSCVTNVCVTRQKAAMPEALPRLGFSSCTDYTLQSQHQQGDTQMYGQYQPDCLPSCCTCSAAHVCARCCIMHAAGQLTQQNSKPSACLSRLLPELSTSVKLLQRWAVYALKTVNCRPKRHNAHVAQGKL